jgi:tetratricopeptide (TPR) repeat protein
MTDRPSGWNTPGKHCLILAAGMMIWVWGCATLEMGSPKDSWVCDDAADAAVERQEWKQALARHRSLLIAEPGNCLAMYHLGYILGKMGDRLEEIIQYEKAVQCGMDQDDLLFFNLGMAYGDLNYMDDALAAFERAVMLDPDDAENYFGLGLTAQAAGQRQRAQKALINAVNVDPDHWEARILLARIYLDTGEFTAARLHLDILRETIPLHEEVVELWQMYEDRRITTFEAQP